MLSVYLRLLNMSDGLASKLDSFQLDQSRPTSEHSYHYVENLADIMEKPTESTVSIGVAAEWQKAVLKDPKVRRLSLTIP